MSDDGRNDQRANTALPDDPPIGIISGGGSLPFAVADAALQRGRRVVIFAVRGSADAGKFAPYPHHWVGVAQIGRLCRLAKQEGCRDLVFIGTTVRPAIRQLRPDFGALLLLPRLMAMFRGGDAHLMSAVAAIFERRGFRVIGAQDIAPEILMPDGVVGRFEPRESDRRDIARGLDLLRTLGRFDVGQATIVAGNHVLAVEAADGTDGMLAHVAELRRKGRIRSSGGVLVKAPKPGQDRRLDLPTIGPRTIEGAVRAELTGIAVVAGDAIITEAESVRQTADRGRLFVVGVRDDPGAR
jgi:UDP-2,3-diacylglucosamine hydrolase